MTTYNQKVERLAKKIVDTWLDYMNEAIVGIEHPDFYKVIEPIILKALSFQRQEIIKEIGGMKKLPYYAQPAQNRNGLDYCATCEQAWEDCSCSARNTGYKKAISDIQELLKKKG